eukprot:827000-Amphidinium_carterae.2
MLRRFGDGSEGTGVEHLRLRITRLSAKALGEYDIYRGLAEDEHFDGHAFTDGSAQQNTRKEHRVATWTAIQLAQYHPDHESTAQEDSLYTFTRTVNNSTMDYDMAVMTWPYGVAYMFASGRATVEADARIVARHYPTSNLSRHGGRA